jgi:hypothetical protein
VLGLGLVVGPGHGKVDVAGASLAGSDDGR